MKREASVALSYVVLVVVVTIVAPSFLSSTNLRDLVINNASVLIVAIGMTLVILTGEIDISVGSQFAVCTYLAGMLAKEGLTPLLLIALLLLIGALLGAVGGFFVAFLRMPSIVVTLALMVAWRDGLRWLTEGKWVQDLPKDFQWFGLGQTVGQLIVFGSAVVVLF